MTIRNKEWYKEQLWDWGFLDDCFKPTKIKVTDIDGFVERNGLFLVIETKSHDANIPFGQQIMFENMIKTGLFTVLIIWGEANQPEKAKIFTRKIIKLFNPADENIIRLLVEKWFNYANNN